jgi:transposase
LDGIFVIRSSEPAAQLPADDAVRSYKGLAQVERAFRCLKGLDLRIRPIFHHSEDHVRAHIFLCLLAYYVVVAEKVGLRCGSDCAAGRFGGLE